MSQAKQHSKPHVQSVETKTTSVADNLSGIGQDTWQNVWNELLNPFGKSGNEALGQLTGAKADTHKNGDLHAGEVVDLKKQKEEKKAAAVEGHREYFREVIHADSENIRRDNSEIQGQVDKIRAEIKQLLKVNKQLEATFKTVAQDVQPVNPGKYHVNFMGFVLSLLRSARVRMEEGLSWASTAKSKKTQMRYQNQAKQKGTSFTLSNERTAATQTG